MQSEGVWWYIAYILGIYRTISDQVGIIHGGHLLRHEDPLNHCNINKLLEHQYPNPNFNPNSVDWLGISNSSALH